MNGALTQTVNMSREPFQQATNEQAGHRGDDMDSVDGKGALLELKEILSQ